MVLKELLKKCNADEPGNHMNCPFHTDNTGSLSVWTDGVDWWWKCHAGCGSGKLGADDAGTDIKHVTKVTKRKWPVADLNLLADRATAPVYHALMNMRKIDKETAQRFGILELRGCWRSWAWVIPVLDPTGRLVAAKVHNEEGSLKCYWLPIGTEPADKPKHGVATLYPQPEQFDSHKPLYLCAGELKALRLISHGKQAVSPTSGESFKWDEEELARIQRFGNIIVLYDDDVAGRAARDYHLEALNNSSRTVTALTILD